VSRPRAAAWFGVVALAVSTAVAQAPPPRPPAADDPTALLDALLSGLLGIQETTGPELQKEVAEAAGLPFRADVAIDFMGKSDLSRYLKEVFDSEYPADKASVDARLLQAFDLLDAASDLRAIRAKVLEENVVGFYDERPGRRKLYAVSEDRRLTPMIQLVLSHELRHAQQDQYVPLHEQLPASVGEFDDRRVAWMSLLEGDAVLVMERFLMRRLSGGTEQALPPLSLAAVPEVPGAPPVIRDHLVLPYLVGREFARALWARGGGEAMAEAWRHPPESTEQVLHPEKYFAKETPKLVWVTWTPPQGRLLAEGVWGELLLRTWLLGADDAAAAGWGGDSWKLWDVAGRTVLAWRIEWDSPSDLTEFLAAARARMDQGSGAKEIRKGWFIWRGSRRTLALSAKGGGINLISSEDPVALESALHALAP
jgi:hypothetical protein